MRKSGQGRREWFQGKHKFEHWYRDHTVYFITARCRDQRPCFAGAQARAVFWNRFLHYAAKHAFEPWVTTLMNNHYHTLGFLHRGQEPGEMMRKIHGSVAKLVNDTRAVRCVPFWNDRRHRDYFDGCIRNEKQYRRAYRYTVLQSVRAGLVKDWRAYPDTRVAVGLEDGLQRAVARDGFLTGVPYARYEGRKPGAGRSEPE